MKKEQTARLHQFTLSVGTVLLMIILIFGSCSPQKRGDVNLESTDTRKIYHTLVGDSNEAQLLQQQMGIEITSSTGKEIWFYSSDEKIVGKMNGLGYKVDEARSEDHHFKYVEVDPSQERELKQFGIGLVNREKDYLLVRGSLDALRRWKASGKEIFALRQEPRPREIELSVGSQPEVQKVYDWGVDIFSAVKDSSGHFKISGSAFDFQIDSMQAAKYAVKIIKPRI